MAQEQKTFKEVEINSTNKLVLSKVEDNGELSAIDIRTWYCTEDDPEWKPTKKGVRIKQTILGEILSSIIENIDEDTKSDIIGQLDI